MVLVADLAEWLERLACIAQSTFILMKIVVLELLDLAALGRGDPVPSNQDSIRNREIMRHSAYRSFVFMVHRSLDRKILAKYRLEI